jgi:hypothetical protein
VKTRYVNRYTIPDEARFSHNVAGDRMEAVAVLGT